MSSFPIPSSDGACGRSNSSPRSTAWPASRTNTTKNSSRSTVARPRWSVSAAGAEVFTLATDDSFPQVYHYYTTYLAQFRAYPPQPPFPPQQNWRTLEVQLNQAMQDPFIPGDTLKSKDKQIMLQVAETEAEPKTVIRYIITPGAPGGPQVAAK